jgi:hypothetical protein
MKFTKVVFTIAGIYGLLVLTPGYFLEARIGTDYPPPITHPEYYYGFIGLALAWQILFLILATDPVRFRPMIIPSILEKVSYGTAVIVLFLQHRMALPTFALSMLDWVFVVLFAVAYLKIPSE